MYNQIIKNYSFVHYVSLLGCGISPLSVQWPYSYLFIWGFTFESPVPPVSSSLPTVLAASVARTVHRHAWQSAVYIDWLPFHGVRNAAILSSPSTASFTPSTNHGINKYRERLPPGQLAKVPETYERQDGARERIGCEANKKVLLAASPRTSGVLEQTLWRIRQSKAA